MFNKKEIERLKSDIEWLSDAIGKLDNLYKYDNHETRRPKVDILSDSISNNMTNIWDHIYKLERKVEQLEVLEATKQ